MRGHMRSTTSKVINDEALKLANTVFQKCIEILVAYKGLKNSRHKGGIATQNRVKCNGI
jgi:hypothetical protein